MRNGRAEQLLTDSKESDEQQRHTLRSTPKRGNNAGNCGGKQAINQIQASITRQKGTALPVTGSKKSVRNYKIKKSKAGKHGFVMDTIWQIMLVEPESTSYRKLVVNDTVVAINKVKLDEYTIQDEIEVLLCQNDVTEFKI